MARILVVTNLFPPTAHGGYELTCGDVVARWRAAGHTVEVLSGSGGELPLTSVHARVPPRSKRIGVERRAQRVLAEALGRRPDVVSVWNMAGLPTTLLASLARASVPIVYVMADAWPSWVPATDPWLAVVRRLPRPLGRLLGLATGLPTTVPPLGPTGVWAFCSRSLRDDVVRTAPEHRPFTDTAIVPWGVDVDDFPIAASVDDRPWRGRLLFVGRLDPVKGIDTLLRAMASLPSATLEVVGPDEPHHRARIDRLVAELGIADRVRIAHEPRQALAERYRAADVCVFPSEWAEPFGIVPLEAMASATPVVATGVGGSGDYLVDGRNALLFPAGDAGALAAAVDRLAADPSLRHQLAAAGLDTAARYTTDRLASELLPLHLPRTAVDASR